MVIISIVIFFQWTYDPTAHTITSKMDGKCVDASQSATTDGTNVQVIIMYTS